MKKGKEGRKRKRTPKINKEENRHKKDVTTKYREKEIKGGKNNPRKTCQGRE